MLKQQKEKILYILSGNEPSTIVRALIFKDEFKKKNIQTNYFQLYSAFIRKLIVVTSCYPTKLVFRILNKLFYYMRVIRLLRIINNYNVIIAVKYVDFKLLKKIKLKSKAILIYDFDDAVWLKMFFGEEEFRKIITLSDMVISDNSYLAQHSLRYNKYSFVVNGPCQIEKFIHYKNSMHVNLKNDNKVVLGWIGSPSTLFYLYKIYDALELIGDRFSNVILKLVGTGNDPLLLPPFEKIEFIKVPYYDQNELIKHVLSFDIGLYPLFLNELSLGRGSLKATIYMAGGIPVVCSSIGVNIEIIKDGINGFIASDTAEWVEKISLLIKDPHLRNKVGQNGFSFVQTNYSIERCFETLLNIINTFQISK